MLELVLLTQKPDTAQEIAIAASRELPDWAWHLADAATTQKPATCKTTLPVKKTGDRKSLRRFFQKQPALLAWALRPAKFNPRLVALDMDSTVIEQEVVDELAEFAGVREKVATITERAMRGELDFNSALAERVKLLAGLPETVLFEVLQQKITLTRGAEELSHLLRAHGVFTYLFSGGFDFFTGAICQKLGLTGHYANRLELQNGRLTGNILGDIVNRERKSALLGQVAERHGVALVDTVAVGDGANDLGMLARAGLGIAFVAKPAVLEEANAAILIRNLALVGELIF
ncbi:MAG: phosphoserine phosphatase SerB [Turneriella sp.]|nr:phosphoserine phosphatase SerB [Turneriella sp.]